MKLHFVPFHIVRDYIERLVDSNKKEFRENYGDVQVDYDHFEALSRLDLVFVTIAVHEGEIIGFAAFVFNENATHYGREAENIAFFVKKEHRNKIFGEILAFSRAQLAANGIPKITVTVKSDAETLSRALKIKGFVKTYETYEVPTNG